MLCNLFKYLVGSAFRDFSSRRPEGSSLVIHAFLVQLMPYQPSSSQHRKSLLLSQVLFYAIFALFMFVLFVSISVLSIHKMNFSCNRPNNMRSKSRSIAGDHVESFASYHY